MWDGFLLTIRSMVNSLLEHTENIAMKFKIIPLAVVLILSAALAAQGTENAPVSGPNTVSQASLKGADNPFSLLSSSRIRWSSSYAVSFFSGGGRSGSLGLLSTSMFYEFSPKLSLGLDVGILHNPGSILGDRQSSPTVLPGMTLDYHPSKAFRMIIDVRSVSGAMYPYDRSAGFWYDPIYPYSWPMQERK
ncbi:hypothetical protein C3F09_02770 [candidate division GN15 bacterium]|uniref:Uncharacterized protein n=1 Tax=candidate division GN15 bacterium TaxID=2072418 RepID=A0A855X4R9_9BACT|nr:MAG: hypothetical protein C3F09_02770 [candidate division GN15 bacterium]